MADEMERPAGGTRKPDDDVGTRGSPPAAGGHQTAEQAAITQTGEAGVSDAERGHSWSGPSGESGRSPPAKGGASGGHADQKSVAGTSGKAAAGHYAVEKRQGSGSDEA